MHRYRIKEAATTRVRAEFEVDTDPSWPGAATELLAAQIKARQLQPAKYQLQVWRHGTGWVDVGLPSATKRGEQ